MTNDNKQLEPIRNDGLKTAIQNLKKETNNENEVKMLLQLKEAKLLAPVMFDKKTKLDPKTGRMLIPNDAQVKFLLVNTSEGKSFFPAFTDMDEAKKMPLQDGQEIQFIVRTMDDYGETFNAHDDAADGIVINPSSENIVLPKQMIQNFKLIFDVKDTVEDSLAKGIVPKGVQVSFTDASLYPTRVINAVHDICMNDLKDVSRVWFKTAIVQHNYCHAFIVESDRNEEEIKKAIREVAVPLAKNTFVLVFPYTDRLKDEVIDEDIPLYDRELGF